LATMATHLVIVDRDVASDEAHVVIVDRRTARGAEHSVSFAERLAMLATRPRRWTDMLSRWTSARIGRRSALVAHLQFVGRHRRDTRSP
jgi:hypothetical protein